MPKFLIILFILIILLFSTAFYLSIRDNNREIEENTKFINEVKNCTIPLQIGDVIELKNDNRIKYNLVKIHKDLKITIISIVTHDSVVVQGGNGLVVGGNSHSSPGTSFQQIELTIPWNSVKFQTYYKFNRYGRISCEVERPVYQPIYNE